MIDHKIVTYVCMRFIELPTSRFLATSSYVSSSNMSINNVSGKSKIFILQLNFLCQGN